MVYSKEQLEEIVRCKRDPAYFIDKYCYIIHPVRGNIPFKIYEFQKDIIEQLRRKRFNITLKARQMGMSTLVAAYCLWVAAFQPSKNILIISITDRESTRFLEKVKFAFKSLPEWLAGKPLKDNEHTVVFESGSTISSISSSDNAGRSEALSLLVIDEAAFIKNIDKIYTAAYPTLSTGGQCIVISTPNGIGNWYHKIWASAKAKDNIFNAIEIHWRLHPDRDDAWYEDQKRQLADPRKVAQELDCEFLASGNTVLSGEMIKTLVEMVPYPTRNVFLGINHLVIYETPKQGQKYVLGADVSTGGNKDYSAFCVLERHSGKVVADYKAKIPMEEFAKILVRVGNYYNTALLGVENNSGYGILVLDKIINNTGYSNIYQTVDLSTGKVRKTMGWTTSVRTRPLMITEMMEAINTYHLGVTNRRLVDELMVFIWNKDKAEAMSSYNDDLVMATAIAWQMRKFIQTDTTYMPIMTPPGSDVIQDDLAAQRKWLLGVGS
jgi:hypothetical protein